MTTPAKFAQLLGITSEPDGWNENFFTFAEQEALSSFDDGLMDMGINKLAAFWSEFAASYLPQIVQSYCTHSFTPSARRSSEMASRLAYTRWISSLVSMASGFPHFVQTRADLVVGLWMKVTERISLLDLQEVQIPFNIDDDKRVSDALAELDGLLYLWGGLHGVVVDYLPDGSSISSLDAPTSARLCALVPFLPLSNPRWQAHGETVLLRYVVSFISYHEDVVVSGMSVAVVPETRESLMKGSNRQWWACQALVDEIVGRKNPCSAGTRADSREDMLACSRCLSVRYCSTEHQKRHWKQHKKMCFKPLW